MLRLSGEKKDKRKLQKIFKKETRLFIKTLKRKIEEEKKLNLLLYLILCTFLNYVFLMN